MSNVLTGIVEPAKQENKNLTDNRPPSARSFFFTFVFLIGIGSLFLWQMARNDNPMWTVGKPLAQPVTRATQAQAIQQAAQVQASPTAPTLATPTMQLTAAPEIRPTLEMGIMPTRYAEPTIDVAALEKQIQLQAERDRQEAEALRVKLDIEKRRSEIGQAAAWGWFWLALAFSGLVIALAVIVNMYARSIVANIKKAGELAKARQNAPQATTKAVEPQNDDEDTSDAPIMPLTPSQLLDWIAEYKAIKSLKMAQWEQSNFRTRYGQVRVKNFLQWLDGAGLAEVDANPTVGRKWTPQGQQWIDNLLAGLDLE